MKNNALPAPSTTYDSTLLECVLPRGNTGGVGFDYTLQDALIDLDRKYGGVREASGWIGCHVDFWQLVTIERDKGKGNRYCVEMKSDRCLGGVRRS